MKASFCIEFIRVLPARMRVISSGFKKSKPLGEGHEDKAANRFVILGYGQFMSNLRPCILIIVHQSFCFQAPWH
jgi:hypothetical protein